MVNKTPKISIKAEPVLILLVGIILLFFIGDIAKKIARLLNSDFLLYTRYSKAIGLIAIAAFIVHFKLYRKKYAKSLIYCLIILSSTFLLSNLFLLNIDNVNNLLANFDYFIKACFLPIFLIPFFSINEEITKKSLVIIQYIFWLNCLVILLAFYFEIQTFRTYRGSRFGYMGLFDRSTYSSYLFIFLITYYYFKYNKSKELKFALALIFAVVISLLVGTKRIYFFLLLLGAFNFFYSKLYSNKYFWIGIFIFIIGLLFFWNHLILAFYKVFNGLIDLYYEKGFLSAVTSFRSDLFLEYLNTYISTYWSYFNYVFGGPFFHLIRPELDLIDSYLFFGIFGPIIYIYLFHKFLFNFKTKNAIILFFKFLLVILTLTSSGIIFSAYMAPLLILFSSFYYYETNKTKII